MSKRRYYDWQATFSRQTGEQGEICIIVGAKNIGKTFGIRLQCVRDFFKRGDRFCEICRTKSEADDVKRGYFDKLQNAGYFKEYIFKVSAGVGYIAEDPERLENRDFDDDGELKPAGKPDWQPLCYFVALTQFQQEKKRTYVNVKRFIFDEAIIDRKDRYHRYLKNEFLILGNLLDTISRQQPDGDQYRVYIMGNACDLTSPYMRYLGIDKLPEFGYSFWNNKHTLLHYVEPWDKEEMQESTLVGRMLKGTQESEMMYGNVFQVKDDASICNKSSNARYQYAIRYAGHTFAMWFDYQSGIMYISGKVPKDAKNVLTIAKDDYTLDYQAIDKSSPYLQMLGKFFYLGVLRYESPAIRDMFLTILDFMGIK